MAAPLAGSPARCRSQGAIDTTRTPPPGTTGSRYANLVLSDGTLPDRARRPTSARSSVRPTRSASSRRSIRRSQPIRPAARRRALQLRSRDADGGARPAAAGGPFSVELAKQFTGFLADVRAKVGATWLPVYACCDCTKDRTVVDRLVEFGMGGDAQYGQRAAAAADRRPVRRRGPAGERGAAAVRHPSGRGRYAVPVKHVPKV